MDLRQKQIKKLLTQHLLTNKCILTVKSPISTSADNKYLSLSCLHFRVKQGFTWLVKHQIDDSHAISSLDRSLTKTRKFVKVVC